VGEIANLEMIQAESMLARTDGTLNCHFSQFIRGALPLPLDQMRKTSNTSVPTKDSRTADLYGGNWRIGSNSIDKNKPEYIDGARSSSQGTVESHRGRCRFRFAVLGRVPGTKAQWRVSLLTVDHPCPGRLGRSPVTYGLLRSSSL
jgi:hypothetical protein